MSKYLIISFFLILISGILTYSKKIAKFRKKKADFFNFYLTVIATFIGVFLAIEFTNYSEFKKEEKNVVKILDAVSIDLSNNIYRIDAIYNMGRINLGLDSIQQIKNKIGYNEIRLPKLFNSIATNESVLRHFSSQGLGQYSFSIESLITIKDLLTKYTTLDSNNLETVKLYSKQLIFSKKLIAIERARIVGDIEEYELDSYYDKAKNELVGVNLTDLRNSFNKQ